MRSLIGWMLQLLLLLVVLVVLVVVELMLIGVQLMNGTVNEPVHGVAMTATSYRQQGGHGGGGGGGGWGLVQVQVRRRRRGGLELAARPVLVVGVVEHVLCAQSLRLVDELPLLDVAQQFPRGAEPLRDLRVVHLRVLLQVHSILFIYLSAKTQRTILFTVNQWRFYAKARGGRAQPFPKSLLGPKFSRTLDTPW